MYADEVASIAGRTDLAALAERPDVMARVVYLLEALRGSMRGTCSKAQPALFSVASAIMTPVVRTRTQESSAVLLWIGKLRDLSSWGFML